MGRWLVRAATLAALLALASAGSAAAASGGRIFNGSRATIAQVPWQVVVYSGTPTSLSMCGGSIISSLEVLTAAHCVARAAADGTVGASPDAGGIGVIAGTSDFKSTAALSQWYAMQSAAPAGDQEQSRTVSRVFIHPNYPLAIRGLFQRPTGDLAVVRLSVPLDLSGPAAKAIALPPRLSQDPDFAAIPLPLAATVAGFGKQESGAAAGPLFLERETILGSDSCGPLVDAAVNVCAGNTTATTCHGDSGSGLVSDSSAPVLIGVVSSGPSEQCVAGEPTYYASLVAPENREWLAGASALPTAPRVILPPRFLSTFDPPVVGSDVSCSAPIAFANRVKWTFTDETGRVLHTQPEVPIATYRVQPADVGHRVRCQATAVSAGGLVASQQLSTAVVQPAAVPPPLPVLSTPAPFPTRSPLQAPNTPPVQAGTNPPAPTAPTSGYPVIAAAQNNATVRRGQHLKVRIKVTRIPAGTQHLTITSPQVGRTRSSRTRTQRTTVPTRSHDQRTVTVTLRIPRNAKTGRRQIPIRLVWRDGDETAHETRTARFRIRL